MFLQQNAKMYSAGLRFNIQWFACKHKIDYAVKVLMVSHFTCAHSTHSNSRAHSRLSVQIIGRFGELGHQSRRYNDTSIQWWKYCHRTAQHKPRWLCDCSQIAQNQFDFYCTTHIYIQFTHFATYYYLAALVCINFIHSMFVCHVFFFVCTNR